MTRLLSLVGRLAVTLGMVAAAAIVGLALWDYSLNAPWTRDGRVRVQVASVAPQVSGQITELRVDAYPDGGMARIRLWGSLTEAGRAELAS